VEHVEHVTDGLVEVPWHRSSPSGTSGGGLGQDPPMPESLDHRLPTAGLDLSEIPTREDGGWDKADGKAEVKRQRERIVAQQRKLWAESRQSLLIVLQATDTGGKDSTIRRVFRGVNPQGVRVTSFGRPTEEELAHDFLWRVHKVTPAAGKIAIWNRSHYEDVLVVRVRGLVSESVWRPRYDHINAFEALLADSGTRILKFFLHISREEQKERLEKRLDRADKHWKWEDGDLADRGRWDDYQAAYAEALMRTSTEHAPWHVVPADRKWYRDLVVARTVADTLEDMAPQWPAPPDGLDGVVVPD
jgi:PPK2 family polyphosphate:nucleotide phosphotransferase